MLQINFKNTKPHRKILFLWLCCFCFINGVLFFSCSKEESTGKTSLILKNNVGYTKDGDHLPMGGVIKIGILASGAGSPLTYLRIIRISGSDTITEIDKGLFIGKKGLDVDYTFPKDTTTKEEWRILVMNARRDTAIQSFTIYKGTGSAYGPVLQYDSIVVGYQNNNDFGHFLDFESGKVYDKNSVFGHEQEIDLVPYYYITSGLSSPTLTCPGYISAIGYYPQLLSWPTKNSTLYDYNTSDFQLITTDQFDAATTDSLLVCSFQPEKVSGNCKYCYTHRVIPFKTNLGKYGLIKINHADETDSGKMVLSIKMQK